MDVPTPVQIGQAYFELHHRIHRLVDEVMNAAGLSLSRAKVLGVLATRGPVNQAAVASELGFAPRSVTDTLDALEREGLATRNLDPHDRRARLVEITPAGRDALERAVSVKCTAMDTLFGALTDAERVRFAALLAAIRSQLDSNSKAVAHV
jgi:DNA-binding MarR family transcriptional regulator